MPQRPRSYNWRMPFWVHWLSWYGYAALFLLLMLGIVGVPVPDEVLLMTAGYTVWEGRLSLPLALVSAALGSMCGITLSYLIGRYAGVSVIHRFGRLLPITEQRLSTTRRWFDRWGRWTLVPGYFVPGVRHIIAIVAGTAGLPWRGFALCAYSGAAIWVTTFILTGYFFGRQAPAMIQEVHRHLWAVPVAIAAILAAALVGLSLRRRRLRKAQAATPGGIDPTPHQGSPSSPGASCADPRRSCEDRGSGR